MKNITQHTYNVIHSLAGQFGFSISTASWAIKNEMALSHKQSDQHVVISRDQLFPKTIQATILSSDKSKILKVFSSKDGKKDIRELFEEILTYLGIEVVTCVIK